MKYDLAVIGGGPGGYTSAVRAAGLDMKVVLFEKDDLGGVCLNKGCIPTKTMLKAGNIIADVGKWQGRGIVCSDIHCDIDELIAYKNDVIAGLRQGVTSLLKSSGVTVIKAGAMITGEHTITANEETFTAENILVAAGSEPFIPDLPGMDLPDVVSSDELLEGAFYRELIIIGGGNIGMEFACLYQRLGCKVTVIESKERILSAFDPALAEGVRKALEQRGAAIYTSCRVQRIEEEDGRKVCVYTHNGGEERRISAEGVLVAIGRRGCGEKVFVPGLAVELANGQIVVDEDHRSSLPHIYAVGDGAKGDIQLASAAAAYGESVVYHIAGKSAPVDLSVMPICLFTAPEIASAGLTAEEAASAGINARVVTYPMLCSGRSFAEMVTDGFIRLVCEGAEGKILGAQLLGSHATELIGELAVCIGKGLTAKDVASVIHPHPTFCEGVRETAEGVFGVAVHMAKRRP